MRPQGAAADILEQETLLVQRIEKPIYNFFIRVHSEIIGRTCFFRNRQSAHSARLYKVEHSESS